MKFRGIYNRAIKKLVVIVAVTLRGRNSLRVLCPGGVVGVVKGKERIVYLVFVRFISVTFSQLLLFLPVFYSAGEVS